MISLYDTIRRINPDQAQSIIKYLEMAGIRQISDFDFTGVSIFADTVKKSVSPGSARTIFASLKSVINKSFAPSDRPDLSGLQARPDHVNKTFLTPGELSRLEAQDDHPPRMHDPNELNERDPERLTERPRTRTTGRTILTPNERFVLNEFIVGCRTGARISDLELFTPANIQNGRLTYTSLKTGITATIPVSDMTVQRVKWLNECGIRLPLMTYNRIIRRLCERAGINDVVTVHMRGKDMTGPKYEFVSSHTARVTMCTILANLGVPALDIMRLAGHTDPAMTARYIVRTAPDLNDSAMNYLNR